MIEMFKKVFIYNILIKNLNPGRELNEFD